MKLEIFVLIDNGALTRPMKGKTTNQRSITVSSRVWLNGCLLASYFHIGKLKNSIGSKSTHYYASYRFSLYLLRAPSPSCISNLDPHKFMCVFFPLE